MKKILTIFKRDFNNGARIMDELVVDLSGTHATEKLDGTNIRLTIRNHILVRVEKRRNPDKIQKHKGIKEPWYIDADEYSPGDKYIWEAARNTDISKMPDGEWSYEAVGPKIQGNPLNLKEHKGIYFKDDATIFGNVPTNYDDLHSWLLGAESGNGNNCGIEGIVWWKNNKPIGKIKLKDFK